MTFTCLTVITNCNEPDLRLGSGVEHWLYSEILDFREYCKFMVL